MPFALQLILGEAFAEIRGDSASWRWSLSKKKLADGLKEYLPLLIAQAPQPSLLSLQVTLSSAAWDKNGPLTSTPVGFLVTSGFENLILASVSPSDSVVVLPVTERTSGQGQIVKAPLPEELTELSAKLKALSVRTLALCFLNSQAYPENETQAATFFREQGFEVLTSNTQAKFENEAILWGQTLIAAKKQNFLQEVKEQLQLSLTELGQNEVEISTLRKPSSRFELSLELEKFSFHFSGSGESLLRIQPSDEIVMGALNTPELKEPSPLPVTKSFLPGPVWMGRSYQPTLLDVLFMRGHLDSFESILPVTANATRIKARLNETLFTLAKNIQAENRIEGEQISAALEPLIIERLAAELLSSGQITNIIYLTGCLAPALGPKLQKRLPRVRFQKELP